MTDAPAGPLDLAEAKTDFVGALMQACGLAHTRVTPTHARFGLATAARPDTGTFILQASRYFVTLWTIVEVGPAVAQVTPATLAYINAYNQASPLGTSLGLRENALSTELMLKAAVPRAPGHTPEPNGLMALVTAMHHLAHSVKQRQGLSVAQVEDLFGGNLTFDGAVSFPALMQAFLAVYGLQPQPNGSFAGQLTLEGGERTCFQFSQDPIAGLCIDTFYPPERPTRVGPHITAQTAVLNECLVHGALANWNMGGQPRPLHRWALPMPWLALSARAAPCSARIP